MAKFFVGQMVKVKFVPDPCVSFLVGKQGVVNEVGCGWYSIYGEEENGIGVTIDGDPDYGFDPDQLEPILPEGAQPSEFSFTELMDNLGVVVA